MKKLAYALLLLLLPMSMFPFDSSYGSSYSYNIRKTGDTPLRDRTNTSQNQQLFLPMLLNGPRPRDMGDNIYGVETTTLLEGGFIEAMAEAGTRWVRRNGILWDEAEPVEGQINWSAGTITNLEIELTDGYREGIEPIIIVRKTPAWAQKVFDSDCGPIRQDKLDAFANFMNQMVTHFSQDPYNVVYWELGNEPDVAVNKEDWPFGCWGDPEDKQYFGGGYYAEMLKKVYTKIKSADPNAQVLVGGLLLDCDPRNEPDGKDCTSSRFLEGILANGGGKYFDGVSYHAYGYYGGSLGQYSNPNWFARWNSTGPVLTQKTPYLKDLLATYGYTDKYLLLSEAALLCDSGCEGDFEETKANYLAQVYAEANNLGLLASIWYDVKGGWRNSGLLDGGEPLPAYYAYHYSNQEIIEADSVLEISDDWLHGFEFRYSDHRLWVVWSRDGIERTYTFSETPDKITDRYGNNKSLKQSIKVDWSVVYVTWNNGQ